MNDNTFERIKRALAAHNKEKYPLQHHDDYVAASVKLRSALDKEAADIKNNDELVHFWNTINNGIFTNVNPNTKRSSVYMLYFIPNGCKMDQCHVDKSRYIDNGEIQLTLRIENIIRAENSYSGYILDYTHISGTGKFEREV